MMLIDYLIEKKIVKDLKEFRELYSIRALKINDELVLDPKMEIEEGKIHKIQIGYNIVDVE